MMRTFLFSRELGTSTPFFADFNEDGVIDDVDLFSLLASHWLNYY